RPTWGVPVGDGQNRTRTGVSAVTRGIKAALVMMVPSLAAPRILARIGCGFLRLIHRHDAGPARLGCRPPRPGCLGAARAGTAAAEPNAGAASRRRTSRQRECGAAQQAAGPANRSLPPGALRC